MLGWLGGGGGGGGRPASQSPPPPQPEQRQERPERPERPESLTVRIGRLHAALVASSDHGQRDALLELTRLLAEVEDEQGAEALRACQSVRIIERVVKLGAKYVREARAPGGDGYDAQLVLCCLANLAFFGGIAAIREAHGLDLVLSAATVSSTRSTDASASHAFYVATLLQNLLFDASSLEGTDLAQPVLILDVLSRSESPVLAAHAISALRNMRAHRAHRARVDAAFSALYASRRAQIERRIVALESLEDTWLGAAVSIQKVGRGFLIRRRLIDHWAQLEASLDGLDEAVGSALTRVLEHPPPRGRPLAAGAAWAGGAGSHGATLPPRPLDGHAGGWHGAACAGSGGSAGWGGGESAAHALHDGFAAATPVPPSSTASTAPTQLDASWARQQLETLRAQHALQHAQRLALASRDASESTVQQHALAQQHAHWAQHAQRGQQSRGVSSMRAQLEPGKLLHSPSEELRMAAAPPGWALNACGAQHAQMQLQMRATLDAQMRAHAQAERAHQQLRGAQPTAGFPLGSHGNSQLGLLADARASACARSPMSAGQSPPGRSPALGGHGWLERPSGNNGFLDLAFMPVPAGATDKPPVTPDRLGGAMFSCR